MNTLWIFLLVIFLVGGCAKPYAQYYHDLFQGQDTSYLIFTTEEPKVIIGSDMAEDKMKMVEEGYIPIGYSDFHGPQINQQQAIDKAKELNASVVILYSKFLDTKSGVKPVVIPDIQTTRSNAQVNAFGSAYGSGGFATGSATAYGTGSSTTYGTKTIYQPYSIDRFSQGAVYWVKTKPPLLGAKAIDLPPELRQKTGSNKGLLVVAVVKQSPAFSADILRGDIIKKFNNTEIIDQKQFIHTMLPSANKKATITLLRDGKEIVKEVKLNPIPEGVNIPK
jgi:hypothetical protein